MFELLIQHKTEKNHLDFDDFDGNTALIVASFKGYLDFVVPLLRAGADVRAANKKGFTALMVAAQTGQCNLVTLLLQAGSEVNRANGEGWTALMLAANYGQCDVVKLLVACGAEIDQRDHISQTALMKASHNGDRNVVTLLLQTGADVNVATLEGWTALMAAAHSDQSDVVALLLQAGADTKYFNGEGLTALILAAQTGHCDVVKLLVVHGAEIDHQSSHTNRTALMQAAQKGHSDVATLLPQSGADVNAADVEGATPVMLAAEVGYCDVLTLLLKTGGNVNAADRDGWTALMVAAQHDHCHVMKILLEAGADVKASYGEGSTALMLAASSGYVDAARMLVDYGAEIDHGNRVARTPLMQGAQSGHFDVVKFLLKHKARTDQRDVDGSTPLIMAIRKGDCDVVALLLQTGADVNVAKMDGWTALMSASRGGLCDVVTLLVKAGADVNAASASRVTALMAAAFAGNYDVVKLLLEHTDNIDQPDINGNTPLMMASQCGHCDVVKLLLRAGADVNGGAVDYWSQCVTTGRLCYVGIEDQHDEFGVTPIFGSTPLIQACISCQWDVAKVLLDAGADAVHREKIGENALMYIIQGVLPGVCQRQEKVRKRLQQKILSDNTYSFLLDVSPFGTTPLSDLLMASLVYNQPASEEIILRYTIPDKVTKSYLYEVLPDRFFNSIKLVGSVLPAPYSGIEGKIALHTVGTALACKARIGIGTQNTSRLTNMLMQTPLHLLAMENHYLSRTWMVERISVIIQQGYSFSDRDINGRTSYHMACLLRNAQFLLCAVALDSDILHNMNIQDNVAQMAIDYIMLHWRKTDGFSLAELCSIAIGKSVLQRIDETPQTEMSSEADCMASVHFTWDKDVLASHFVSDMRSEMLLSIKKNLAKIALDSRKIKQMFENRTAGVARLNDKMEQSHIITVLGLLHCIGLEMQNSDELFECIPVLKGSVLEQTKCGALDEMDLSMKLINFTEQLKLDLTDSKTFQKQGKVQTKPRCSSKGSSSSSSSILFRNIHSWVTMEPKAVTME